MSCFVVFLLFSQKAEAADSLYVEQSARRILMLKGDGQFDLAHQLADSFYTALKSKKNEAYFKGRIVFIRGRIEIDLGNYDQAIHSAQKSIGHFTQGNHLVEIAGSLNLIGVGFYFKNQLDSTLVYYNKSFRLKRELNVSDEALAISAYNLGIVFEDTGKFDEAEESYHAAAKYLDGREDEKFLADVYLGLANTFKHRRDFSNAQQYADLALTKAILRYGEDNPAITFFYISYAGILTVLEEYNKAAKFINQTIRLRNKFFGPNHLWTAEAYVNLGKLYRKTNDIEASERALLTAIDIQDENKNIYSSMAQFELAKLYHEQGLRNKEAFDLANKYIEQITPIYGDKNRDVAEGYLLMAQASSDSINFYKYLNLAQTAANYRKDNLYDVLAPYVSLEALVATSKYLAKNCGDFCSEQVLLDQAELIPDQVALIQYMYNSYSGDESKIQLGKYCKEILAHGIDICYQLYHRTHETIYLENALELSELNRNTILLKGIQENRFKLMSDVDSTDIRLEKSLMEKGAALQLSIAYERAEDEPSIEALNRMYEERSRIRHSQDSLSGEMEAKYARLKKLRTLHVEVDLNQLQSEISSGEQYIVYFLGEQTGFVFSITSTECRFEKFDDVEHVKQTVQVLESNLAERKPVKVLASNLYNQVLQLIPRKQNVDLVFILDNLLNAIPFEILIDENNQYLIESHAVRYAGSLQLINQINQENYSFATDWVGFSPSYKNELALFNTKSEVQKISNLFSGTIFMDDVATKKTFLNSIEEADILHLAMHTEIDNINPMLSKLLFYEQPLYASELYNQKFPAAMVVLSACESGRGKLEAGEGVMSLSRAFSFAGVPATIMSLWKIPDKQTPKIMVPFYQQLKSGKTKSQALRLSKLQYLKEVKQQALRHPFYWAGFVLNGDDVGLQSSIWPLVLSGIFVVVLLVVFFLWKKRS